MFNTGAGIDKYINGIVIPEKCIIISRHLICNRSGTTGQRGENGFSVNDMEDRYGLYRKQKSKKQQRKN